MDFKVTFLLIFSIAMFLAFFSLKLLPDYQRYAIFVGNRRDLRYVGLKGPGIFMKWPSMERTWVLISVGEIGQFMRPGVGKFGAHEYPIVTEGDIPTGSSIKIVGFITNRIIVT